MPSMSDRWRLHLDLGPLGDHAAEVREEIEKELQGYAALYDLAPQEIRRWEEVRAE